MQSWHITGGHPDYPWSPVYPGFCSGLLDNTGPTGHRWPTRGRDIGDPAQSILIILDYVGLSVNATGDWGFWHMSLGVGDVLVDGAVLDGVGKIVG